MNSIWDMSIEIFTLLASISASSMNPKKFKPQTVYSEISEQIKPLHLIGLVAEFKFEYF